MNEWMVHGYRYYSIFFISFITVDYINSTTVFFTVVVWVKVKDISRYTYNVNDINLNELDK